MYLRCKRHFKDGKEHCYWNIVEAKRCTDGRVVQRQVLYLGEINGSQREAQCRVIEAFDEHTQRRGERVQRILESWNPPSVVTSAPGLLLTLT